ncbi:YdeI family protein [Ideonella sp. A 288]|uniref:YdeI/OmpD-associated family protein n=1 Tax=Ideonella sp. A 288 TaxID=1962181 RepID=UPI000B4A8E76|nr:YdeI/OmpD-associated family protein [Ideonella sp. A 288]
MAAMPTFFATAREFGAWLAAHGATEPQLIVGFHKRDSGRPSMTWPESVDEALCVGWIDGVRARIDEHSYKIRFTPRKPTSTWSAVNIERVRVLQAEGRMTPAGLAAFAQRREARSKVYAYEQAAQAVLDAADEARFRAHRQAWAFFEAQPPGYRHLAVWRIVSAKRPDTRQARLDKLIEASAQGLRV